MHVLLYVPEMMGSRSAVAARHKATCGHTLQSGSCPAWPWMYSARLGESVSCLQVWNDQALGCLHHHVLACLQIIVIYSVAYYQLTTVSAMINMQSLACEYSSRIHRCAALAQVSATHVPWS